MLHLLCAEYGPPGEWDPSVAGALYLYLYKLISLSTLCTWNPTTSWSAYNEISTAGFESLIYDYKLQAGDRAEGKTGIVWWEVKSTKWK